MLRILEGSAVTELMSRRAVRLDEAELVVAPILEAVRTRGDAALHEYAERFDGFGGASFLADEGELASACDGLSAEFRAAVGTAAANVRKFAEWQLPCESIVSIGPGIEAGQLVRPVDTIAAYIPSGRYPLPSTLIMTAVTARVAGVPQICVMSPKRVPEIDGVAHLLGVNRVFRLGGAHAIAAFAFGTETVPRADRIVGPGNIYVAAAKKLLVGETGIDFVAGPTEIVIIAADADARHVAADMLAQAEHDTDASAIFLTTNRGLAERVAAEVEAQLVTLPTRETARVAINRNSAAVIVPSLEEAAELSNRFAPEHLSLYDEALLPQIRHAGSVFLGAFSPEAAGDYAAGPNHVLPTSGAARLRGGLSVADFVKVISVQRLTRTGLISLAKTISTLARAEGLEGHARSVEVRLA